MLQHYFKVTFREQLKYKTQAIVSIIGLTIGFTAFILGGYWLWWETHFDNFHPQGDRLYCLTTSGIARKATGAEADLDQLHINDRAELKKLLPEIQEICIFANATYTIKENNTSKYIYGLTCDHSFFKMFRTDFITGTNKGAVLDGLSVVLTQSTAMKFFGTTNCIGKVFELTGHYRPVVVGVIKDYPDNSDLIFQFLIINKVKPIPHVNRNITYVRLYPGSNVRKVKEKLALYKSHADDPHGANHVDKWKINLRTPAEVHLYCHPELESRIRNIHILAFAGLMAFLSALMNLLVLFIGQQQRKKQKNRTYLCIGASPRQMLLKGWIELFFPMFFAYLLAFCLMEVIFPYYESYTTWNHYGIYEGVSRHIDQSALVLTGLAAILVSTVLFGLFSFIPIRQVLCNPQNQSVFFKRGLIAGQIFIGSLFFFTSLVLFQQLHFILTKDKGIRYENVLQVDMGFENAYEYDLRTLAPELRNHPSVDAVCYTAVNSPVFTEQGDYYGTFISHLSFDPAETDPTREDYIMLVSKEFFSLFGLTLEAGEWLDDSNTENFLVNRTGFRKLGYKDLLERNIYKYDGKSHMASNRKVAGLLNDYLYAPMQYPVLPIFFRLYTDQDMKEYSPVQYFYVRHLPGHQKEVTEYIRQVVQKFNHSGIPSSNLCIRLSDLVDKFNRPEKVIFSVFSIIAVLCILISTFGIYSLVSLSAQQRKKEIAIRKVNGATFLHILQLFFREYLILVIISNLFALPLGYILMQQWLETYANHINLTAWPFIAVFFITCGIVLLSIFRQVRQAAQANPAESIKAE